MGPPMKTHLVVVVALAMLLAGCVGSLSPTDDADTEDTSEYVENDELLAAIDETDTYTFEMTQSMEMGGEMTTEATGQVDETNEQFQIRMEMPFNADEVTEMYLVDGTMYTSFDGEWVAIDLEDETDDDLDEWGGTGSLDDYADLIAEADLERTGTKEIDGVETDVIDVGLSDIEGSTLFGSDDVEGVDDVDEYVENWGLEEMTFEVYLDPETDTIYGYTFAMETSGDELSVGFETEMRFSDHGEPVDITLPEEAEDAMDMDDYLESEFGEAFDEEAFEDTVGDTFDDEFGPDATDFFASR